MEMISNGGTKPGSAISERVELGPRAPNVDLTSMSLGDVNAYVLTASRRKGVSQTLVSSRLCIGIGVPEIFDGTKSPGSDPSGRLSASTHVPS